MSVRTMARVWEQSRHKGSDLLMLLAIADFADDDGYAYPSVPKLAEKCRMSPRNANLVLSVLRESGELDVRQNEGPKGTNLYRVTLKDSSPLKNSSPLKRASSPPEESFPIPLKPASDEPSVNHQEPSDGSRATLLKTKTEAKKSKTTLRSFMDSCKSTGEMCIPEDDPIYDYAEKVGLSDDMLRVCWKEFCAAYLQSPKTQADWRSHFRNAVRRNWYKLWFFRDDEPAAWTTSGEQARRAAA